MWGSPRLHCFLSDLWPCGWDNVDISVKKLVPVFVADALWKDKWNRKHICFHSDNMAVVSILKPRTSTSVLSMHSLRCLFFYCALYSFSMSCVHNPGVDNVVADALSQDNLTLVSSIRP